MPGKQAPEVVQFKTAEELDALLTSVKAQSLNFEDGKILPNKAHLFLKITVWMDSRFQSVTVVDIAGIQSKGTYLERSEINKTASYLGQIIRSNFTFNSTQSTQSDHKNRNSKIYKEFSAIIQGNSKLCFLCTGPEEDLTSSLIDVRVPLIKQRKQKFNKHFIEFDVYQNLIAKPVKQEVVKVKTEKPRSRSARKPKQVVLPEVSEKGEDE